MVFWGSLATLEVAGLLLFLQVVVESNMPLFRGNRATSGDGTAIVTAPAGHVLKLNGVFKLQAKAAGPINALVKLDAVTVYSAYMVSDGDGELLQIFPLCQSAVAGSLYINLDVAKSVDYAIDVEIVKSYG